RSVRPQRRCPACSPMPPGSTSSTTPGATRPPPEASSSGRVPKRDSLNACVNQARRPADRRRPPSGSWQSAADAQKERPDRLGELFRMVEIGKVRSGRTCDLHAEALREASGPPRLGPLASAPAAGARGEPSGPLSEERVAAPADEKLDRGGDRGKRLLVGKVGIERAALDAEVGIPARQDHLRGAPFQSV